METYLSKSCPKCGGKISCRRGDYKFFDRKKGKKISEGEWLDRVMARDKKTPVTATTKVVYNLYFQCDNEFYLPECHKRHCDFSIPPVELCEDDGFDYENMDLIGHALRA